MQLIFLLLEHICFIKKSILKIIFDKRLFKKYLFFLFFILPKISHAFSTLSLTSALHSDYDKLRIYLESKFTGIFGLEIVEGCAARRSRLRYRRPRWRLAR